MSNSVKYRKNAQECFAMAELVGSAEAKQFLVSMAQRWHRLAHEVEEQERTDVVWTPGSDPVADCT